MNPTNIAICSKDADRLKQLLAPCSQINVVQCEDKPAQLHPAEIQVLLADPLLAIHCVPKCSNLKWLQSTWAGNAPLTKLDKQDYTLTVAKGVFDKQIREYVFTYLLAHVRKIFEVERQTLNGRLWQTMLPSYLSGKTLGILGTGSLARALLPVAQVFGLKVIGMSKSGSWVEGFDCVYPSSKKQEIAARADFVVNLLPDTLATKHLVDFEFFSSMKRGSLLINAGRGSAIDNQALLEGLKQNQPSTAVLDVFDQEPLPKSHPFWSNDRIHITHHTAAITQLEDIIALFLDNINRYQQGHPLLNILDWQKGY